MTIGVYLVPAILARLQKIRPGVHVQLEKANTEMIAQAAIDGIADIGVVEGTVKRPKLHADAFATACRRDAAAPRAGLRFTRNSPRRSGRSGVRVRTRHRNRQCGGNIERSLGGARDHVGVGARCAAHDVATIEQLHVKDLHLSRTLRYIRRRDLAPSPAMVAFIELLEAGENDHRRLAFAMPK